MRSRDSQKNSRANLEIQNASINGPPLVSIELLPLAAPSAPRTTIRNSVGGWID